MLSFLEMLGTSFFSLQYESALAARVLEPPLRYFLNNLRAVFCEDDKLDEVIVWVLTTILKKFGILRFFFVKTFKNNF